ncbi:MAG: tetratricopeptide repeat protein [Cyanobacteria bacterium J06588_4]
MDYSRRSLVDTVAYQDRGYVCGKLKDFQGAIADYTQATKCEPQNPDNYYHRANAYNFRQQYQLAIADYSQ